jgi:hypothetical protein
MTLSAGFVGEPQALLKYLAGIQDTVRVHRPLDSSHQGDFLGAARQR